MTETNTKERPDVDEIDSDDAEESPKESSDYPMSGISKPGEHDVLCGRGGGTNNHSGNIKFRKLVNEHKLRYLAATKVDKPKVAREVVKIWRAMDPPGRFLAREEKSEGSADSANSWSDVGDKKAREKASQCLRERTPDVLPFIKKLQEQQQKQQQALAGGAAAAAAAAAATAADVNVATATNDATFFSAAEAQLAQQLAQQGVMPNFDPSAIPEGWAFTNNNLTDNSGMAGDQQAGFASFGNGVGAALHPGEAVVSNSNVPPPQQQSTADPEMTLEEYQRSLEEYLAKEVPFGFEGGANSDVRAQILDSMKKTESNYSIDTFSMSPSEVDDTGTVEGTFSVAQQSIPEAAPSSGYAARLPDMAKERSRTSMMRVAHVGRNSNMSMFSDITDASATGHQKSNRSAKMGAAKVQKSDLSMMSELTDMSSSLAAMELGK